MAAMVALGAACRPGRSGPGPEARFEHQARPGNPRKDDPHILRANGAKPTWHDLGLSFRDRLRPAVAADASRLGLWQRWGWSRQREHEAPEIRLVITAVERDGSRGELARPPGLLCNTADGPSGRSRARPLPRITAAVPTVNIRLGCLGATMARSGGPIAAADVGKHATAAV
jgi:hypothetical protein